jgi:hypothetical protein
MRIWNTRTRNLSSRVIAIVMAFVFASAIGGIFTAPAFGKDNDRRERYQQHGRHERGRRVYQPARRYYPLPVYAPPPVVYTPAPYQSPGISLFFPIHIR